MLIALLTSLTMIAFAANSVLCRLALGRDLIDPLSFTSLRLASGAAILILLSRATRASPATKLGGSWVSGLALFSYAAAFSLAYTYLDTGTGALVLFGSVQATMIGSGLRAGERPHPFQWLGLIAALGGLVYLVSPGITAPAPLGTSLMAISGISWGIYSIRGKGVKTPLVSTSGNFVRAVPLAIIPAALAASTLHASSIGAVLAVTSGSLTSGLGYALWYRALRGLSTTKASIVQLSVPVLAALGGTAFLAEQVSMRLILASALVLGGVAAALSKPGPRE